MKALQYSALALGVVSAIAAAESNNDSSEVETMIITANRFEQTEASVLAATNVVTREDIEVLQAKSTTDVLKTLPGIEIGQNGGRGQVASIFVRGSNSKHILVLVDGFRMATSALGSIDFNQIPLTSVERIEYVRGPRATAYGSDAIAGVINIVTKSEFGDTSKQVQAGFGSFQSLELAGTGRFSVNDSGQLKVSASVQETEGYNSNPVPSNAGDKHGFESKAASIAYEHLFNEKWSAYVSGSAYENDVEFAAFGGDKNLTNIENKTLVGSINYSVEDFESALRYNYSNQKNTTYDATSGINNYHTFSDLSQNNLQWLSTYYWNDDWIFSGGVDWQKDRIGEDYTAKFGAYDVAGQTRHNSGLFATVLFERNKLTLELSARGDDNSDYGGHGTWSAGIGYDITDSVQFTTTAGTAFRAPSMADLYGYGGNTELEPEESQSFEVGLRGVVPILDWRISAYENRVDNLVESICVGWDCTSQNVQGESKLRGIEFEGTFHIGAVLNTASLEFRDPKNEDGELLARRAKQVFKLNSEYEFQDWTFGGQILYQGERGNSAYDDIILDAYTTLDATVAYQFTEQFLLEGKVVNLSDTEYETASGYPAAERSFFVTANYTF